MKLLVLQSEYLDLRGIPEAIGNDDPEKTILIMFKKLEVIVGSNNIKIVTDCQTAVQIRKKRKTKKKNKGNRALFSIRKPIFINYWLSSY